MASFRYSAIRLSIVLAGLLTLLLGWYIMNTLYHGKDFSKHFNQNTTTYYLGRFTVELPDDLSSQPNRFMVHHSRVKEVVYDNDEIATQELPKQWAQRKKELIQQPLPRNKKQTLIRHLDFTSVFKQPTHGFYYYGHRRYTDRIYLDIITVVNNVHVTFTGWSKYPDRLTQGLIDIVNTYAAYHPTPPNNPDSFFTPHGRVDAPWNGYEETHSFFTGGVHDITLTIKTYSRNRPPEESYLIKGYKQAPLRHLGLKPTRYRLRKHTLAGMAGEEAVFRLQDATTPLPIGGPQRDLNFIWRFQGEENSGTRPWIEIKMTTSTHNLKQKLALWDTILNSFQPIAWVTHRESIDYDADY